MREFDIENKLDKILIKLLKRDKKSYEGILKKINEIVNAEDVEHYKNLRRSLQDFKRVHIGHFVLAFKYDKTKDKIIFYNYDHHDKIYN
jgi:YafQ family addiction module toxin component